MSWPNNSKLTCNAQLDICKAESLLFNNPAFNCKL
uniref:Uncharacterized protein n=1 Tax=Setaria italica TaxID=4555 RepID=K3YP60_SETIT